MPSSSSVRPRRTRAAIAVAAAVLSSLGTSACRVDVSVGLDANPDGTGEVRAAALLDADAVTELVGQAAGNPASADPASRIKVDDLRKAGWKIEGPTPAGEGDGGLEVVATHPYADAAEARRLLTEVAGDPGPFKDITLRQERGFFKTTTHFTGTVDLDAGLGAFTDPELRQALQATDDAPLGVTQEQLERRLGAALDRIFGLQVAVRLPGKISTSNAPTETDNGAVWAPRLGEEVTLEAASERWNVGNIVALVAALAAAAALLVTLLRRLATSRRADDDIATDDDTDLTVTDGNITVPVHGETGADGGGARSP